MARMKGKKRGLYKVVKIETGDVTDPVIPISWFTAHSHLSPGQALSFFLVHELGLDYVSAAALLVRDETTVRRSYAIAVEKEQKHREALAARKKQVKQTAEVK